MVKRITNKNISKILFELEKIFYNTNNPETQERWAIYTELIKQLQTLDKHHYIHELYYRILVGENINNIFVDLINRDDEIYFIMYPYIYALEEFFDFDEIKIFV